MDAHPAASLRSARWLAALCLVVAALGATWSAWDMFGPARKPMLQGWDDSFYYYWLPSAILDGDVDFSNQLAHSRTVDDTARDEALQLAPTPRGLLPNKYPPGWAIGSAPFFLAAHLFAPPGSTGFEPRYLLAVWLGQMLYAAGGLWLATRLLRRYFPADIAAVAVLSGWLASPLVYYQSARLGMSHSQVFALAMAVFCLALRIREGDTRRRTWAALGFVAALMVVTRNVTLVYLALPAWVAAARLRTWPAALALLGGAMVPAALQLAAWRLLYGSWVVYSYGGEQFDFSQWHTWQVLFSPQHGWFYWHPLLLLGTGAFLGWAARRGEGRCWLLSLGAALALNSAWPSWWLGSSFGHRGFEVATLFAMVGLARLWAAAAPHRFWRRVLAAAVGAAVSWNLLLLALFLAQRIPREAPVTFADAVRALANW